MRPYELLGGRGQLGRIRRLGRDALAAYPGDLKDGRLTLLRHEQNVTYRVDSGGTRHVLRISRPDLHSADTIGSEMAWLAALAWETSLRVPSPVTARDGALVVAGTHAGVPEARPCVLLRWVDGRFLNLRPHAGPSARSSGPRWASCRSTRRDGRRRRASCGRASTR